MTREEYKTCIEEPQELLQHMEKRLAIEVVDQDNLRDLIEEIEYPYQVDNEAVNYLDEALYQIADEQGKVAKHIDEMAIHDVPDVDDVMDRSDMLRTVQLALECVEKERVRVTPRAAYIGCGGEIVGFDFTEAQFDDAGYGGITCHACAEKQGLITHEAEKHEDFYDLEKSEFLYMFKENYTNDPDEPFEGLCGPSLYCAGCSHEFYDHDHFLRAYKEWLKEEHGITVVERVSYEYTYEREEDGDEGS